MVIYDVTKYYILYQLLELQPNEFISCNELCKEINLTSRTVSTLIDELSPFCMEHGFQILSKKSAGYEIVIIDSDKAMSFKERIFAFFKYYNNNAYFHNLRALYIWIYLCWSATPVSISRLSEIFYVSKTTIYNDINMRLRAFDVWKIEVINQKGRIKLNGTEFDKRNFILSCYNRSLMQDGVKELFQYDNSVNDALKKQARNSFNLLLDKYGISLNDEIFSRLISWINISKQRYLQGFYLENPCFDLKDLKEYQCVVDLSNELNLPYSQDAKELSFFTALLVIGNEKHNIHELSRYGNFQTGLQQFFQDVLHQFHDQTNHIFASSSHFEDELFSLLARIYFAQIFGMNYVHFNNVSHTAINSQNQVEKTLSRILCQIINDLYCFNISGYFIRTLYFFFKNCLNATTIAKEKLNILFVLLEGRIYSSSIEKTLCHYFHEDINLEIVNQHEVNQNLLDKSDIIFLDYSHENFHTEKPVYHLDYSLNKTPEYSQIIIQKLHDKRDDLSAILKEFRTVHHHSDYEYQSFRDLITHIYFDFQSVITIPYQEIINNELFSTYYSGKQTMIVLWLTKESQQAVLSSYSFNNRVTYNLKELKKVFFLMLPIGSDIHRLRKLQIICEELATEDSFVAKFASVS